MDYIKTLNEALNYIEEHLDEELSYSEIANYVAISPYHFMHIFKGVTGLSLMEYIRNRQLYQSALDLAHDSSLKVIDVAYKYHYANPEGYTKAFVRFCGISPSKARKDTHYIKTFMPIKLGDLIKGGQFMDYEIVEMKEFEIIGVSRRFGFNEGYNKIPSFWGETVSKICNKKYKNFDLVAKAMIGKYGICINDNNNEDFDYIIAGDYHNEEVPEGFVVKKIPASLWAKFKCVGPLPASLQSVNTRIWNEWLPSHKEYELSVNIDIEVYSDMPLDDPHYESEIWLPIKRVNNN